MPKGVYDYTTHLRRARTGAATRHGISLQEYQQKLADGLLWCTGCKAWHRKEDFGLNRAQRAGRNTSCRAALSARYKQRHIYVTPETRKPMPRTDPAERFWRYVKKCDSGCWEWQGTRNNRGYGALRLPDGHMAAHRFSWELHNGPIPDGLIVCHKCDNPPCVNPEHLFLGTYRDNNEDRDRKGRTAHGPGPCLGGEANPSARLTLEQVQQIRSAYIPRKVPCRVLAERFGMSEHQIQNIVSGKNWR